MVLEMQESLSSDDGNVVPVGWFQLWYVVVEWVFILRVVFWRSVHDISDTVIESIQGRLHVLQGLSFGQRIFQDDWST